MINLRILLVTLVLLLAVSIVWNGILLVSRNNELLQDKRDEEGKLKEVSTGKDFNQDGFIDVVLFDPGRHEDETLSVRILVFNPEQGMFEEATDVDGDYLNFYYEINEKVDEGWIFVEKFDNYMIYKFENNKAIQLESGKLGINRDKSTLKKL